jgi:hypothetical protein
MAVSTSRGAGRFSLLGLALGYLALVPPGLVLFVLVAGATVLIPAWVGVPLVLAVLALLRSYTGLYRARAARILGTAVERPYRPVDRRGWFGRLRRVAGDPATWRDLAWLPLNATVGLVLRVFPVALLLGGVGVLAFPLYWPVLPPTGEPNWIGMCRSATRRAPTWCRSRA